MKTMISRLMAARAWREKARNKTFTNAEFARGLGVQQASVNYWQEKQEGDLKVETVFKASDFLGVDARWLATGHGRMSDVEEPDANLDAIVTTGEKTMLLQLKNPGSSPGGPPRQVVEAVKAVADAYARGAPVQLFEAVYTILALLPGAASATIDSSKESEVVRTAARGAPRLKAGDAFDEEQRAAESHLASRSEGSGAARRTIGRKRKSA